MILRVSVAAVCLLWAIGAEAFDFKPAVSLMGTPKYTGDFVAFDYVNPDAPRDGNLNLSAFGSFDTLNPFVINGIPPAGIGLTHDTLMKQSADEAFTLYGLVADGIAVLPNGKGVAFHIHPNARFHDGSPVTADDVVFSFHQLREKGVPTYRYYYQDVVKTETPDKQTAVFYFRDGVQNRELPLILGELPVLSKAAWEQKDFDKTSLDIPVTSGPYRIKEMTPGRSIMYERVPDYWAADLPVNRGFYHFKTIKYMYFRDTTVAVEAFKAGEFDLRFENEAKKWVAFENEKAVLDGRIRRVEFTHGMPSGMQGFVFNLRRPIFEDRRVRVALGLVFDFDWMNANLFHGLYRRTTSFFDNSSLKAPPLPDAAEQALLMPFQSALPKDVFETPFQLSEEPLRDRLRRGLDLLEQSGWRVDKSDGLLKKDGQPFTFEILLDSASVGAWERIVLPFAGRLKRLGITANIRVVDPIQYKNRLDEFDFDMIVSVWGQSLSPGNEQRYFWSSSAADSAGSMNYAGVKHPAVDSLVEQLIAAPTLEVQQTTAHALDRVLLHLFFVIPHWHTPVHRFLLWDKIGTPTVSPIKGMDVNTFWENPAVGKDG